jgi:hypothetical protein
MVAAFIGLPLSECNTNGFWGVLGCVHAALDRASIPTLNNSLDPFDRRR